MQIDYFHYSLVQGCNKKDKTVFKIEDKEFNEIISSTLPVKNQPATDFKRQILSFVECFGSCSYTATPRLDATSLGSLRNQSLGKMQAS